jgi:regulator of sigma E protease
MISAILVFAFLIFFHELGHFLFAKWTGVLVEKFSIGFGPVLISKKWGETEYMISAIPLGGYVKMYGENPDEENEIEESLKDRAFSNKKLWQRFLIVFAGPFFNFILAVILFALIFKVGFPHLLPTIGKIQKGMPAYEAGLKPGDKIVGINSYKIKFWDDLSEHIKNNAGKKLIFKIERGNKIFETTIIPKVSESKNIFGETIKVGLIGVSPKGDVIKVSYGFFESINKALVKTYDMTVLMIEGIKKMIQRIVPADSIGGPIMIFQLAKTTADQGILSLLHFMAFISINLAILNLLPIPVLDGGHLLFYAIEGITRRPVSVKVREKAQMIGLALILLLMFFAFYNDIMRIVRG